VILLLAILAIVALGARISWGHRQRAGRVLKKFGLPIPWSGLSALILIGVAGALILDQVGWPPRSTVELVGGLVAAVTGLALAVASRGAYAVARNGILRFLVFVPWEEVERLEWTSETELTAKLRARRFVMIDLKALASGELRFSVPADESKMLRELARSLNVPVEVRTHLLKEPTRRKEPGA
jgi:hypothetical protein